MQALLAQDAAPSSGAIMIAFTLLPPFSTGTNVGAYARLLLFRANSTLNGVSTPVMRSAVSSSISSPGRSINDP